MQTHGISIVHNFKSKVDIERFRILVRGIHRDRKQAADRVYLPAIMKTMHYHLSGEPFS